MSYQIMEDLENNVVDWATCKGLVTGLSPLQHLEESQRTMDYLEVAFNDNPESLEHELGNLLISLTLLAKTSGTTLTECLAVAYDNLTG
jgi:hypothetical protein